MLPICFNQLIAKKNTFIYSPGIERTSGPLEFGPFCVGPREARLL